MRSPHGGAVLVVLALLLGGCTAATATPLGGSGSPTASPTAAVEPPASASAPAGSHPGASFESTKAPGTSAAPLPSAPPVPAGSLALSEPDNGRTVSVATGATVTLVLHNTYWTIHESSAPAVLALVGPAVYAGGTMACIPGTGCGTVTATFRARADGRAVVSASRTACGEALACTGTSGSFEFTVVVAP